MRILVIEDEPRMSALLQKGLSEHGHDVTVALSGAEGLKCTLDREFEVILLDLGLPDLSGYDVAQVLREKRYPASILMLTAYNKEDEVVRGLNLARTTMSPNRSHSRSCLHACARSRVPYPGPRPPTSPSQTWLSIRSTTK